MNRLLFVLLYAISSGAAENIQQLLAHKIMEPDLTLSETQSFLEKRIPRMPKVTAVEEWEKVASRIRSNVFENVIFRGEAKKWRDQPTQVKWLEYLEGGPGYRMRKLLFEAVPGYWVPAVLYEPNNLKAKAPVFLNVNGHDPVGKAAEYKQMRCINQAKRGIIALNVEWFGMGQLTGNMAEHYRLNQLDLVGTSGISVFYLAMKRGLDVLLMHPNADSTRVGVAGLSGGGWQTIFISSLDTRVTLANPVAGYSSFFTRARFFEDLGDSEQTPSDLATVADYTHLTAMRAPHPTLLTFNEKDDCCFATGHARAPLMEAAGPVFKLYGNESALRTHSNADPGTHNFLKDNRQQLYRFIGDSWFPNDPDFKWEEIPSDGEIKTREQMDVPLPEVNASFHSLALALLQQLPPRKAPGAERLKTVVQFHEYEAAGEKIGADRAGETEAGFWKLKTGTDWTVPAVVLSRGEPAATVLVICDEGRTNAAAQCEKLLAEKKRVIAMDPFLFGESKIKERDFLFALFVATVGERPLGIEASQIAAVANWAREQFDAPVAVQACGPRVGVGAWIARALNPKGIKGVSVDNELKSLGEIIEKDWALGKAPELFCFGLLKEFDLGEIKALGSNEKRL